MNAAVLLNTILNDLLLKNIQVKFELTDTVYWHGSECVGYFDSDANTLCIAANYDDWFLTLVHEYCHFLQFQEGLYSSRRELDLYPKREKWSQGLVEMGEQELYWVTRMIQSCELDCERRVIEMVKKYTIPTNIEEYIRHANAYVLSYEVERLKGRALGVSSSKAAHLCPITFIDDISVLPIGFLEVFSDDTQEANSSSGSTIFNL
jgi:hypothetical protein